MLFEVSVEINLVENKEYFRATELAGSIKGGEYVVYMSTVNMLYI
jgi:hypothetical protein